MFDKPDMRMTKGLDAWRLFLHLTALDALGLFALGT